MDAARCRPHDASVTFIFVHPPQVLIVGARGVGVEVAKNTVLAGVHTLTLFDPTPTSARDLGSNFFLTEEDIGKSRAAACAPRVADLNANVSVSAAPGSELTEALVAAHTIVVFTMGDKVPPTCVGTCICSLRLRACLPSCSAHAASARLLCASPLRVSLCASPSALLARRLLRAVGLQATLCKWNAFCRSHAPAPISFLCTYGGGAWGGVFVDHGDAFTIRDANGRAPLIKLIKDVEVKADHLLVRYDTPDGQPPEALPDGGLVEFDEVGGLTLSDGRWPVESEHASPSGGSLNGAGPIRTSHDDKDPVKTFRVALPAGAPPPSAYTAAACSRRRRRRSRQISIARGVPGERRRRDGDGAQGFRRPT